MLSCLYPACYPLFNSAFESLVSIVTQFKYEFIIAGDYNIDLIKSKQHTETDNFVNNLSVNLFVTLITKPTQTQLLLTVSLLKKPQNTIASDILI